MNSKMPRSKVGLLDLEINMLSKILFVLMLLISAAIITADGFTGYWYFKYFRFLLLLASIIPISLRVNLDMAKIYYAYSVSRDPFIQGTVARNSTIPEELGRIQFLLSDKTGTLTQNDMIFKRLSTEYAQFTEDSITDIKDLLEQGCREGNGPSIELAQNIKFNQSPATSHNPNMGSAQGPKKKRREQHLIIKDLILALSLCHNVTPTFPRPEDPEHKEL